MNFGDKAFLRTLETYPETIIEPYKKTQKFRAARVQTVSFITKRPDNGEVIYEMSGSLHQSPENHLLKVEKESYDFLKNELTKLYGKMIEKAEANLELLHDNWYQINKKKEGFQEQWNRMEEKNALSHCPKRYTAMAQLEKAIRREERRDVKAKSAWQALESKIKNYQLGYAYSVKKMESEIEPLVL